MPSKAYHRSVAEAAAHHAASKTYSGKLLRPHKPYLSDLIALLDATSVLDIGCGKGAQYEWVDHQDGKTLEQAWGVAVTKYDPAWPPFATEPVGTFDLVICTHVLGSVPIEDLDWFFDRVFGFADKAVFFAEKLGPVKKSALTAPGRPTDWTAPQWLEAVKPHAKKFQGETHFSFRYREAEGAVYVDRYRCRNGRWSKKSNRP